MSKKKTVNLKALVTAAIAECGPLNAGDLMARTGAGQAELQPVVDELVNADKSHTMKGGVLAVRAQAQISQGAGQARLETVKANNGTGAVRVRSRKKQAEAQTPAPAKVERVVLVSIDQLSAADLKARIDACADELQGAQVKPLVAESLERIIRKYRKQLGKRP